ncbi:hypothetical protein HHX38_30310 [Streptomyces sp. PKU-MA01144]|uniref:hypothetical protein n=1 Tax=Streptomyces sp. PKU-MA01144 TaxID=2729138 RepID=UPI00147AA9D7|nr:hypothetical protein [Streptomyces sp. PKU-MA01144]NNJ08376.1 hypothetical protein [Streptomyces sp. PKU-MA01144]
MCLTKFRPANTSLPQQADAEGTRPYLRGNRELSSGPDDHHTTNAMERHFT